MAATPEHWELKDLHAHLQAAVGVELLVMPPYLTALYSLHPGSNREAELIIRSVVVEEMLHLALAANVLNAVGGKPRVTDAAWTPRYPAKIPYHDSSFAIGLLPFGKTALDAFLAVENPSYAPAKTVMPAPAGSGVPRLLTLDAGEGETYATVGDFYQAIAVGLEGLVERLGEEAVFSGCPEHQIGPEHYYAAGGTVLQVTDLATALEALTEVVEQGEGELTIPPSGEKFDRGHDLAHFYRFDELRQERRYLVGDEPRQPTGDRVEIDFDAVYPMQPNLRLRDIPAGELHDAATACCRVWSRLLDQVQTGISGRPAALSDAVVTMFELKYSAQQLLRVPLADGSGKHAGPTFEYLANESTRS